MAVTKRLRYEILRRDNHACRYCGAQAPDVVLTVDHVTPKALGGTDTADNLVAACKDCNAGKSSAAADQRHVDDVADDALRWAKAIRLAAFRQQEKRALLEEALDVVDEAWRCWHPTGTQDLVPRPDDWDVTIGQLLHAGLPQDEIVTSIRIAMSRSGIPTDERWRYFCGVCWRTLEDLHDDARRLIDRGVV